MEGARTSILASIFIRRRCPLPAPGFLCAEVPGRSGMSLRVPMRSLPRIDGVSRDHVFL